MPRRNTVEIQINADDNATVVINQVFNNVERQARETKNQITQTGESLRNLGVNLTLAAAPFVYGFQQALSASIEFESAFAGVVKTVDGTDEQLQDLRDTIRAMATDTTNPLAGLENAHLELAKIMELGGQLGIPIMALEDFTSTVGMLGMATNLTTEDAATMIAQFANITGMSFENFDRFGSTLVDLGNNSATTEDAIMRMASRIAGAGAAAGFTETEILGFAAALSSMGINAELGGSNFSKLLTEITKMTATGENLQQLATISGMTANEFKTAWGEDATGALLAFIGGMSQLDTSEQIIALEDLGLTGTEMTRIMQSMTGNVGLLGNSLDIASSAWAHNNALVNEANARFETTEAKANLARNALYDLRIEVGDALKGAFDQVLAAALPFINGLVDFVSQHQGVIQAFALVVGGVAALGVAFTVAGQASIVLGGLLGAINWPLVAIGAAVAGAVWAFENNFLGIRDFLEPGVNSLINIIKGFGGAIQLFLTGNYEGGMIPGVAEDHPLVVFVLDMRDRVQQALNGLTYIAKTAMDMVTLFITGDYKGSMNFAEDGGIVDGILTIRETFVTAFTEVKEFIEGTVIPALNLVWTWFTQDALPAVINFITGTALPAVKTFFTWIGDIWKLVAPALGDLFDWFVNTALPNIVDTVTNNFLPSFKLAFNFVRDVWKLIAPALSDVADWFLTSALPAIKEFIDGTALPALKTFFNFIRDAWKLIAPALQSVENWFQVNLAGIKDFVENQAMPAIQDLIDLLAGIWDDVQSGLNNFFENMDAIWSTIRDEIIGPVKDAIQDVITFLQNLWSDVSSSVQDFADGIGELLGPVAEFIGGLAGSIEDLKTGLQSLPGVANQAGDLASAATSDPIRFFQSVGATLGLNAPPAPGGSADGGFISGGFPRIVGERGPELFVPPSAGRVIPNDEISGRGGGFSFGDIYVSLQNGGYAEGQAAGRGFAEQLELELRRRSA